jgi:hypothetical protein
MMCGVNLIRKETLEKYEISEPPLREQGEGFRF